MALDRCREKGRDQVDLRSTLRFCRTRLADRQNLERDVAIDVHLGGAVAEMIAGAVERRVLDLGSTTTRIGGLGC